MTSSIFIFQFLTLITWLYSSKSAIFGTNDDELISSISSGHFNQINEIRLIFIQPLIGEVLKYLQILIPNINAYSYFLLFVVVFSYSLLLTCFILTKQSFTKYFSILIMILFDVTFITWFSINPTYTGASIISVGVASFLFFYSFQLKSKKDSIYIMLVANILLLTGYFIRKESIFIFLIISFPLIIKYIFIDHNEYRYKIKIIIYSFILFIALNFVNEFFSNSIYQNQNWSEYIKMNNARHQIQLRTPEVKIENYLNQLNWDEETYTLFKRFSLLDKKEMNSDKMIKILNLTSEYIGPKSILKSNIKESINKVIISFNPWTWILKLLAFYFILLFIIIFSRSYKNFLSLFINNLIFVAPILFFTIILAAGYQLPERITLNFLAAIIPLIVLINLTDQKNTINLSKFQKIIVIFLILIMSINYLIRFKVETDARLNLYKTRIVYSESQQETIKNINVNKIIMGSASAIKADWRFPYSKHYPFGDDNKIISLGWLNLSPIWIEYLKSLKINGDNFPNEYFNSSILIVESPEKISILENYLFKRKFSFKVENLGNFGNSDYQIYQFIK